MGLTERWIGGIREKMTAIVNSSLTGDEKLLAWTISWVYSDALAFLPVINLFLDFLKHRFLLAVTSKRLLLIQIGKVRYEEIARDEIESSEIQSFSFRKWLWEYKLKMRLADGSRVVLKDIPSATMNEIETALEQLCPGKQA
ncbi:MAG TPA: hypothetical protein DCX07_09205 [Phycisphaerales bacterium]|nr:hypothetical protein [Phycisphaerales bacterium]